MSKKKKQNSGLELVVERNEFYRDGYKRAIVAVLLLIAINAVLALGIFFKSVNPVAPQYFPTTADGRLIKWHPLSDPVVSDDFVLQWSANAVRKAFSLDFEHYQAQLQSASDDFTPAGWKYFVSTLQQSNNLNTLTDLKMVSSAMITGAPQIVEKELLGNTYAWKVEMSILVTYKNRTQTIPMPMKITLIVLRVPVKNYPDRIAINNFLPEVEKTATQELMQ